MFTILIFKGERVMKNASADHDAIDPILVYKFLPMSTTHNIAVS